MREEVNEGKDEEILEEEGNEDENRRKVKEAKVRTDGEEETREGEERRDRVRFE